MILKDTSNRIVADFTGFISAVHYDTLENHCAGLKIVDILAENDSALFFIEIKNYINTSDLNIVQTAMDQRQKTDYLMLTDPIAALPLEMGMKFKDSLFRCLAAGDDFKKPIIFLLLINSPPELKARDRERLISKIRGYIPTDMHTKSNKYPRMQTVFFDMPIITEVYDRYGFRISVQR